jgi:hypothetical protein
LKEMANWKVLVISVLCLGANSVFAAECDEVKGTLMAQKGNVRAAFKKLESCSRKQNASADTLLLLAELYEDPKASRKSGEEAYRAAWSLKHKAAVKGNLDALIEITRAYGQGEAKRNIKPDEELHSCLVDVVNSAAGHGKYESDDVVSCLKG